MSFGSAQQARLITAVSNRLPTIEQVDDGHEVEAEQSSADNLEGSSDLVKTLINGSSKQ